MQIKGYRLMGSHNSGTGQPSKSGRYKLVAPFARTQSKTIREQYEAGVRAFDLRVRHDNDWRWWLAHGLWISNTTLWEVLCTLENIANDAVWVNITYEGALDDTSEVEYFKFIMQTCVKNFKHIHLMEIAIKEPAWRTIFRDEESPKMVQDFDVLDKRNWRRFIPVPWLWWAIRKITRTHAHKAEDKGVWLDFV